MFRHARKLLKINIFCSFIFISALLPACGASTEAGPAQTLPASPSPVRAPEPTPIIRNETALSDYASKSGRFRIKYPNTWELVEQSDGAAFLEPNDYAGYRVIFSDVGESYSEQELVQFLVTFVAKNFLDEATGFQPISQETRADGTIVAQFSSHDTTLDQTVVNELRVMQQETIVYTIHLSAVEEQWEASGQKLQTVVDTLTPFETAPDALASAPTDEPPVWELAGPESREFSFFVASDWEILKREENLISVGHPDTEMVFTTSKFSWPNAAIDARAAERAALEHISSLSERHENVRSLSPTEFPLNDAAGTTIDFLYTANDGTEVAGSVITVVYKGKMYKLAFTAPAEIYDAALQWFNPMVKSFTFLSPDEITVEEP